VIASVGVVGAGAMGTLLGVHLARAGCELEFLVKTALEARRLRERGLVLKGGALLRAGAASSTRSGLKGAKRFVFLMVKSLDTASGLRDCSAWVGPETWVVSLQNGLTHVREMRERVGVDRAVLGTTTCGATMLGVGEARLAGLGETVVGGFGESSQEGARQVAALLRESGLPARTSRDIRKDLWNKLLVNACVNPVGAVLGWKNGELAEARHTRDLMRRLAEEAAPVAQAETKSDVSVLGLYRRVLSVCRKTAENRCSMLQDLERNRATEVDSITGEIVRIGKRHGFSLPTHEAMSQLVKALEGKGA